jgi:hypothetical protein
MTLDDQPLVSVHWVDAHSSGTRELTELELPTEPILCVKYGRLLRLDKRGAVIAGEDLLGEPATWRDVNFIVAVLITKIEVLSTGEEIPIPGRRRGTRRAEAKTHDSRATAAP